MAVGLDDAAELQLLRSQGDLGLAELWDHYRPKLARTIALRLDPRILGKLDGDDLLQDVFVEAARRIQDYLDRPDVPLFVWLRQLACQALVNTHRRYLGAQMRDATLEVTLYRADSAATSSALLVAQLADSLTTPSQMAVREERVGALRGALARLEPIDREVLVLRHLEELTNDEVAQVLGIDKYAASKRYLRALKRLRTAMPAE
jgi:RNA polymerase sigma-70 factor (ECF subfamily)